jgi:D-lactate dehydrogenase
MEHQMWTLLDARRAEYPAEHNVGHLYIAKPALANFYQKLIRPIALMSELDIRQA